MAMIVMMTNLYDNTAGDARAWISGRVAGGLSTKAKIVLTWRGKQNLKDLEPIL